MTEVEILRSVWLICQSILGNEFQLYLYGSRAKGTHEPTSDFDFAIQTESGISPANWLELHSQIAKLKTLYKIDLADCSELSDDFKKVVQSHWKEVVDGKVRT